MEDESEKNEATARRQISLALVALLALVSLFVTESGFAPFFVILSFFIGYLHFSKVLFFVESLETRRKVGRTVLHRLSDEQVGDILKAVRAGHKIQAIKELRAINGDGLKEAREAVDLLGDFALKWRDSIDKPPR
jgi:hypothetical protein